jgi:hypothetical protein
LFPSFDSEITFEESAQTRIEGVSPELKFNEGEVAVPLVPEASVDDVEDGLRVSMFPLPLAPLAFCQVLEKLLPVEVVPILEIVAEKVVFTPAVAEDGETEPAVRSGRPRVVKMASGQYPVPALFMA